MLCTLHECVLFMLLDRKLERKRHSDKKREMESEREIKTRRDRPRTLKVLSVVE